MKMIYGAAAALIGFVIFVAIIAFGRDDEPSQTQWKSAGRDSYIKITTIEGHDYVMLRAPHSCSILHAASCKCQERSSQPVK